MHDGFISICIDGEYHSLCIMSCCRNGHFVNCISEFRRGPEHAVYNTDAEEADAMQTTRTHRKTRLMIVLALLTGEEE